MLSGGTESVLSEQGVHDCHQNYKHKSSASFGTGISHFKKNRSFCLRNAELIDVAQHDLCGDSNELFGVGIRDC